MIILLNGKEINFSGRKVSDLLDFYNLDFQKIVVEKNGFLLSRDLFKKEILAAGDKVEIISFGGGG